MKDFEHQMNLYWWETMASGLAIYFLDESHGLLVKAAIGIGISTVVKIGDRLLQQIVKQASLRS
jgi:hypothetical protein